MAKKVNIETIKREQAFQLYKKLRNVKEIAELPGMPSYSVLLKWKEEDKWDERIEQSRKKLEDWTEIISKLENDSLLKDDVMQLILLNKLLERTIYAIIEKDLEPTTWREAIDTLKIIFEQKRLLLGRPTSKSEIDIDLTSKDEEELRQMLRRINEYLQAPSSPFSAEEKLKQAIKQKIVQVEKYKLPLEEDEMQEKSEETEEVYIDKNFPIEEDDQ